MAECSPHTDKRERHPRFSIFIRLAIFCGHYDGTKDLEHLLGRRTSKKTRSKRRMDLSTAAALYRMSLLSLGSLQGVSTGFRNIKGPQKVPR